ncbi:MAG: peptidylprolyl isomerase [Candidatus Competibacteraceae bacterium]
MFAVARRQILSDALLARYLRDMQYPDFTDLAHEYYLTHRQEYRTPNGSNWRRSSWKVACECERGDQRALAEKILVRLQAGESFEDLAKQYSNDKTSAASGACSRCKPAKRNR